MADETEAFPSLPAKQWWALRALFKRSMPSTVTANYIESTLDVEPKTARNLIGEMRTLKLLDAEGKPTDIAEDWRHDDTYAQACQAIRKAVYPEELLHASPNPSENRAGAERWFARRKKVGENAALKMAITYQLVSEADLTKAPDTSKSSAKPKDKDRPQGRSRATNGAPAGRGASASRRATVDGAETPPRDPPAAQAGPTLHIDVQVHIAADATPAQIDQIFASMAKHLYRQAVTDSATGE